MTQDARCMHRWSARSCWWHKWVHNASHSRCILGEHMCSICRDPVPYKGAKGTLHATCILRVFWEGAFHALMACRVVSQGAYTLYRATGVLLPNRGIWAYNPGFPLYRGI